MAGTDFSTRTYSYDDYPDDVTLSNFSLTHEDFDFKAHIFFFMDLIKKFFVSFKFKVKFFANKYLLDTVRQLGQKFKFQINQAVHKVQYKIFYFFLLEKYKC